MQGWLSMFERVVWEKGSKSKIICQTGGTERKSAPVVMEAAYTLTATI
jgi:hypothetical protein